MQVPKLVNDEADAAKGDLLARLHPLCSIIVVDDDSYLKHDINLNAKGPFLAHQLSDHLASAMPSNMTM